MTTLAVTGNFMAVGISAISVADYAGRVTYSVSGTYSARVVLEKSVTPAGIAWVPVTAPLVSGDSGSFDVQAHDTFRMRCLTYTSGTCDYALQATNAAATIYPTDSSGLLPGTLWNNGGVLCIA